jgi:hypothetical protein
LIWINAIDRAPAIISRRRENNAMPAPIDIRSILISRTTDQLRQDAEMFSKMAAAARTKRVADMLEVLGDCCASLSARADAGHPVSFGEC